jgi:hypothetical protein
MEGKKLFGLWKSVERKEVRLLTVGKSEEQLGKQKVVYWAVKMVQQKDEKQDGLKGKQKGKRSVERKVVSMVGN